MKLYNALVNRFGEHRVEVISNPRHPEQSLIRLYLELAVPVTVILTNGLSDYSMPVSEKWKGREFNELCFCLPSYWELDDTTNPNFYWVYDWLFRFETFVREKETWFGPGHTIPAGNPIQPISGLLKQEYFLFGDPMLLRDELAPIQLDNKPVHFLVTVPIFGDEFDYKIGKGTHKFFKRYLNRKNTEVIDDFRPSILKSRMIFF